MMRLLTAPALCGLITLFALRAHADYAWIPESQNFHVRAAMDFFSSGSNYANDGFLDPVRFGGQSATFHDRIFRLEPEFGVAEDWAVGLGLSLVGAELTSDGTGSVLASGMGFGDMRFSVKWRVSKSPLWVIEGLLKLPSGTSAPSEADELVNGEGNVDMGVRAHYGIKIDRFYISVSPGLLARFGGYVTAGTLESAAQMFIYRAYARIFVRSQFSFGADALPPSTVDAQTLPGSGGSYARLAASPTTIAGGATVGVSITRNFRAELGFERSFWGQRTPNFTSINVGLLAAFDLSSPDLRPRLREVPFENSPSDF